MEHSAAPYRCFCGEVSQEQHHRVKLRVMGTVVGILSAPSSSSLSPNAATNAADDDGNKDYAKSLILDDGTGDNPQFLASNQMIQAVKIGMTVDCVVRIDKNRSTTTTMNHQNANDISQTHAMSAALHKLIIETLIIMPDNEEALSLRSCEILYQRQGCPGQTWGLPRANSAASLTSDDINDIIQAEADVGVRLEDFLEMFDVDKTELQEMIQELQMQGLVYQSKSGAYLPL